ncbi:MAG: hypothetical protein HOD60_10115 [Candidatus Nitrosopelagicus sp.]|nr:hypothetical protein [Candidatus Nitrosopelagicus sp.]
MNDRETIVHIITAMLYYDRAMKSQGTPMTPQDLGCIVDIAKIALFPHVSDEVIEEIGAEVLLMDKKLNEIMKRTVEFGGPQQEISR